MRETRQSGSEGGARCNPASLPLSIILIMLTATKAFAAVEAFVAGTVAHGHMPAVRASGSVLLKVGDGVAEGLHRPRCRR